MYQGSTPSKEERPWGNFITFVKNAPLTVKLLTVLPQQAFSLQRHHHRDEQWHIISGNGTVTVGDVRSPVVPGADWYIPRETLHRLEALSDAIVVLELSFGLFDEEDIIRVEDRYGRH
ncbi:MAG TPA: phosphomannose isomerase type II C-terminal cupin domain [Candidatus Paceibacterota bacterium]|nr:phosphomannose isomerase type II C-terminal cupin domain [Candidatus Paceibacterota bacterium]